MGPNFERIDETIWLYVGDWLHRWDAEKLAEELAGIYPEAIVYEERDSEDSHNGWNVMIEFNNPEDEAIFIMKESL